MASGSGGSRSENGPRKGLLPRGGGLADSHVGINKRMRKLLHSTERGGSGEKCKIDIPACHADWLLHKMRTKHLAKSSSQVVPKLGILC